MFQSHLWALFWSFRNPRQESLSARRTPGAVERSAARVGLICDTSNSTAAAQQQWWWRRRGSGGGELPFGEVGCCFVSALWSVCFVCASWLWAIHQQQRGFLQQQRTCYATAPVMTTVVGRKRTLLPATGTPCRVSRQIHHTASSDVRPVAGFCPHVKSA